MKSPLGFIVLASMAYTSSAAPTESMPVIGREIQAAGFGLGSGSGSGNIFGGIFDTAACIFSAFIGGAGCRRPGGNAASQASSQGASISTTSTTSNRNSYDFNYSTNSDGSLKLKITPAGGVKSPCNYDSIAANDRKLDEIIYQCASKCATLHFLTST